MKAHIPDNCTKTDQPVAVRHAGGLDFGRVGLYRDVIFLEIINEGKSHWADFRYDELMHPFHVRRRLLERCNIILGRVGRKKWQKVIDELMLANAKEKWLVRTSGSEGPIDPRWWICKIPLFENMPSNV